MNAARCSVSLTNRFTISYDIKHRLKLRPITDYNRRTTIYAARPFLEDIAINRYYISVGNIDQIA